MMLAALRRHAMLDATLRFELITLPPCRFRAKYAAYDAAFSPLHCCR